MGPLNKHLVATSTPLPRRRPHRTPLMRPGTFQELQHFLARPSWSMTLSTGQVVDLAECGAAVTRVTSANSTRWTQWPDCSTCRERIAAARSSVEPASPTERHRPCRHSHATARR